ncbi:MAG: N-methyl-L-tryptophan oxidase [Thermomicrobiales bacterium]|nr:N-methyl-L-tryptophan oxidase [Thermomicrobiales bacterium]
MTTTRFDVLIAGGGTMGTAAAWALSKRGVTVGVFEQFDHVNDLASHGGHTRIFRHAYSEGEDYVPLMRRADQLWVELGELTGQEIVHRVGILEMDAPGGSHAKTARVAAQEHDIAYEWMTSGDIRERWPAFNPPDDWEGGYSAIAGFLMVEPALRGMADLARQSGKATFFEQSPVTSYGAEGDGVWLESNGQRYEGERLIVTGGAWSSGLLEGLSLPLTVVRKVLAWLEVKDPAPFQPDVFPVFAADTSEGEIYGFPIHGQPGLKISDHHGGTVTTPDEIDRYADSVESERVFDCLAYLLPGVTRNVLSASVCMYTRTPDEHFIIDRHPLHRQIAFACGFSGHGFKFATEIGEHLADLALKHDAVPYELFRYDRFI